MNQPKEIYWIAFYFGQNIVMHPDTGRWILTGYLNSGLIECKRNIGQDDEDVELYRIDEVKFILKKIQPTLFTHYFRNMTWIKWKSGEGFWVFDQSFNQILFEDGKS